jgi:hypothetical protein
LSGVKVKSPFESIQIFLDRLYPIGLAKRWISHLCVQEDVAMIVFQIVINVTGKKESIPKVPRDSPLGKRIDSNAAVRMTVMAFFGWVGRKLFSMFFGGDES